MVKAAKQDREDSWIASPNEPKCEMSALDLHTLKIDSVYNDAVKLVLDINMMLNSINEVTMQDPSHPDKLDPSSPTSAIHYPRQARTITPDKIDPSPPASAIDHPREA